MKSTLLCASLCSLTGLALALPSNAQTGPWTDGELIMRGPKPGFSITALYRVVPETGACAELAPGLGLYTVNESGTPGGIAFDNTRAGLLISTVLPPDGALFPRLWVIAQDGSATAIPALNGSFVRALAPTGDGRVFFLRHTGSAQGAKDVEYLDAANGLHTLLDAGGVAPFQLEAEHMAYHAASNALIATMGAEAALTPCVANKGSLYRIPLSADGTRVGGAVSCVSFGTDEYLLGLDPMPDGNLMLALNDTSSGGPVLSKLQLLNPTTLVTTPWADGVFSQATDGGLWSQRIGKGVVLLDPVSLGFPPLTPLRTYSFGENGNGGALTSTCPAGPGGHGPAENLWEVDLTGPACAGLVLKYGAGLAGAGGFVPELGALGCPDIGELFTLAINAVSGGAPGMLVVSLSSAALPFAGGTLLVGPLVVQLPLTVGGPLGVPNAGALALPVMLTDPVLAGLDFYFQAGFLDLAAVQSIALSNGLRLQGN